MAVKDVLNSQELKYYYDAADNMNLTPGWVGSGQQAPPEIEPFLWRWSEVEPLVLKSGEVVTPDRDVERRTMRLATPGLQRGTTHTLVAALQLLLPGECAPSHRHTPTAIRWILTGKAPTRQLKATSASWNPVT